MSCTSSTARTLFRVLTSRREYSGPSDRRTSPIAQPPVRGMRSPPSRSGSTISGTSPRAPPRSSGGVGGHSFLRDAVAECTSRELLPDSYYRSKRRAQVTRGIDELKLVPTEQGAALRRRTAPPPRVHAPSTPRLSGLPPDLRTDLERLRGADGSAH